MPVPVPVAVPVPAPAPVSAPAPEYAQAPERGAPAPVASYLEGVPHDHAELVSGLFKVVRGAAKDLKTLVTQAIAMRNQKNDPFGLMSEMKRIVVVGASLAGLRAVEFIRRAKFEGELVLIGEEGHLPYDRPPLSKEVLRGEWDQERIALRRGSYDDLNVELVIGQRAVSLDSAAREVRLESGAAISFDGMVIATGGRVRTLPNQPRMDGVHTLRTLDDTLAIREALAKKPRVAVIGAGFIGAEVAASARQLGLDVTMIEALRDPARAEPRPAPWRDPARSARAARRSRSVRQTGREFRGKRARGRLAPGRWHLGRV